MTVHDLFIIGGGINGCGIARDAAGRGYSVYLAEMNDLGSGTSRASTKLIHGGLRYLEHYEFRLVRESLMEREVLWGMAPHIIHPLRFVLPHHRGLRPAWLLRLGLFLYDHLGGRKLLPPTRTLDMRLDEAGKPLKPLFSKGFEYSDCWVDDARLVILNARDAASRGAVIRPRTKVVSARRDGNIWSIEVENAKSGRETVKSRMLVNAAGPWVDSVIVEALGHNGAHNVRLVQGSHIIVPKIFGHDRAYIFQNADNRIIFAIPYERDYTLIGTTDRDWPGDAGKVEISPEEIAYLCNAASEYFAEPVNPEQVVWTYSGVRPLYDDGASKAQEATRDYVLKVEGGEGAPALLNIFGGKITTFRRLAEHVLEKVESVLGAKGKSWTRGAGFAGGGFAATGFDGFVATLQSAYPFLTERQARRYARLYGTDAEILLGNATKSTDLGATFGPDLTSAEVDWLVAREWAETAEDITYRRTKAGLGMSESDVAALTAYLQREVG